jgi:hypothetical protein
MLYTSINEIKNTAGFVSFGTKTTSIDLLREDILAAENELSSKYLGATTFDALQTAYDAGIIASSFEDKLLAHVQRYVSHKALYSASSKINVQVTKQGIQSHMTDTEKPVREWMLTDLKNQLLNDACYHLDALLSFMEANKAEAFLADWRVSSFYLENKNLIINSLDTFELYYFLNRSYTTFLNLKSVQWFVATIMVKKCLGADFYNAITAEIKAAAVSSDTQTLLDEYIYPITAFYTVARALKVSTVSLENGGIKINEYISNLDSRANQRQADIKERELLAKQLSDDACALIEEMKVFLNANASETMYADWFNSSQYEDPNVEVEENKRNREDSGFFAV